MVNEKAALKRLSKAIDKAEEITEQRRKLYIKLNGRIPEDCAVEG